MSLIERVGGGLIRMVDPEYGCRDSLAGLGKSGKAHAGAADSGRTLRLWEHKWGLREF